TAELIGQQHQYQEHQQDAGDFAAGEHAQRQIHLLTEPAGADETHHHRRTHRAFPAIDGIRDEFASGIGQHAIEECDKPRCARAEQRARRPRVDRFENFRVDLAEHAGISHGDRKHTGAGAKSHRAHE
ncbi:conserved hypothetical protein, partial [Ricinus communis]